MSHPHIESDIESESDECISDFGEDENNISIFKAIGSHFWHRLSKLQNFLIEETLIIQSNFGCADAKDTYMYVEWCTMCMQFIKDITSLHFSVNVPLPERCEPN